MFNCFKVFFLHVAKFLGFFSVTRWYTKNGLRILCYHNFSAGLEAQWRPQLFINPKRFEKRINYLKRNRFSIVSLQDAVTMLQSDQIVPCSVVITIDDGWKSTTTVSNMLANFGIPYTIYLTSQYSKNGRAVEHLLMEFLCWVAKKKNRNIDTLQEELSETTTSQSVVLYENSDRLLKPMRETDENTQANDDRNVALERLSESWGSDGDRNFEPSCFEILSEDGILEMNALGADFQLHTHRHRLPLIEEEALAEIEDNRRFLVEVLGGDFVHFCYPGGHWDPAHFSFLRKARIISAVTCIPGLNYTGANVYALKRFLDSEDVTQIEFEAELCGFLEVARKVKSLLCRRATRTGSRMLAC